MAVITWTEAEENLLIELWAENKSAGVIAQALGPGYTRSAVLGKVNRMRAHGIELAMRVAAPKERVKRKQPPNFSLVGHATAPKLPPTPLPAEHGEPLLFESVGILDARYGHCRAVIGHDDSIHKLAIYCGSPVVNKTSFCQSHFDRFYQVRIR